MRLRCEVCGSKDIDQKLVTPRSKYYFCSKRCRNIKYANRFLFTGFLMSAMVGVGIFGIIAGVSWDSFELITVGIFSLLMGGGFSGYFFTLGIKGKQASKGKEDDQDDKRYGCLFCGQEYSKRVYGAPTYCSECGKPSPFCDICYQYVFHGEEAVQFEDCGHIFHKSDAFDWLEENMLCPKCKEKVNKINLKIS